MSRENVTSNRKEPTEIMTYTLNSGISGKIELTREQQKEWIEHFKTEKKFIKTDGKHIEALDPKLVSLFRVNKSSVKDDMIPVIEEVIKKAGIEKSRYEISAKAAYKVICKCGARYVSTLREGLNKLNCKYCGSDLYPDRSRAQVNTIYGDAWITMNYNDSI